MKVFIHDKPKFYKVFILSILLFFIVCCWEFLSIDQPDMADPNSTFEVPITVALTPAEGSGRGHFGIRLPVGWSVEDNISFSGVLNGTFMFSSQLADSMEKYESSADGYYWWVGVSDSIHGLPEGNITFTPRISTDDQTGNFFIDYIISDRIVGFNNSFVAHSGPHIISIDAPMEVMVTNTNDSGEGSLRQAISNVSSSGEVLFNIDYPATIVLDNQLVIDRNLTITGPESGQLTISGNNKARVFYIGNCNNVNISNLTIADGNEYASGDEIVASNGGGILCRNSILNLENVSIINNMAVDGGGIKCEESDVILKNVSISMNKANGWLRGIEPMDGDGGGLYCSSSNISFTNVRINGNTARNLGGGIIFTDSSEILFDKQSRCNIYNNNAVLGNDLYNDKNSIINVVLDTFTVLYPTSYYTYPRRDFNFDILNAKIPQYDSDLYVKTHGDNNNNGTSWSDAFKNISFAFSRIMADSLHPHTIFINDGIYNPSTGENFPLRVPDYVTLSGTSRENVILDAEQQGAVIQIFMGNYGSSPPPKNFKQTNGIENVTITGGNESGIQCWESILELNNVKIENNFAESGGGGICCKYSLVNSTNTIIINNAAELGGGGIKSKNSEVNLKKVLISSNSATSEYTHHGGGIFCNYSLFNMTDVRIIGNSGAHYGGGIANNGEMYLFGVTIAENVALYGGGICFSLNAGAYFDSANRCNIYSNIGSREGDDLYYGYDDTTKIAVIVDTFTFLNPTNEKACPLWKYDFDILHDASVITDLNEELNNLPKKFDLSQNYPNPFNPVTMINYQLPMTSEVELSIYNILGQKVATLVNKKQTAGNYEVQWDATGYAGGVYFYQLVTNKGFVETKKLLYLR